MAELRIKRRVCIRSGPGEDYSVLCWLNEGDTVESPDTEGWVPVLLEDEEGENLVGWVEDWNVEEKKEEEDAVAEIVKECLRQGVSQPEQIAYVVATAEWETGKTFKPVKEAFWLSEEWRKKNLRYYPYYGRGYVQLTWESNYRKYSKILGIDLVGNPDLALEPKTALFILVHGMRTGAFTGKKLSDYINEEEVDFVNARRIVNALDKAEEIAKLAQKRLEEVKRLCQALKTCRS